MSTSTDSEPQSRKNQTYKTHRIRAARPASICYRSASTSALDEVSFWTHQEEREFGRLALESDHLFDTSYPWAT